MIEIDVENILPSKNILAPDTNEGFSDDDDGDDDEDYEEHVETNDGGIKRKRTNILWKFQRQLDNEMSIEIDIKPNWKKYKSNNTRNGKKDRASTYWTKKKRGIQEEIKDIIKGLYDCGTTGALNIIYALRDKGLALESIPSQKQIYNMLSEYKKEKFGNVGMTYLELRKWCEENINKIFLSDNDGYLIDYYVSIKDQYFRVAFSTNQLIQLSNKRDILVVDSTYKIIFQGYPLMIAGTVDFDKHFHPLAVAICTRETKDDFEFLFRSILKKVPNFCPKYLLADGADAITNGFEAVYGKPIRIMCWAHTERAVSNKLKLKNDKNETLKKQIMNDFHLLQLSFSQTKFNITYKLFKRKWERLDELGQFFDYFEKEWIHSKNFGWFEGFSPGYPSTNNALEATNNSIKKVHTFKERIPFSQFLERLKIILNRWSVDRQTIRLFASVPVISDSCWLNAIEYLEKKPIIKYVESEDVYLLSSSNVDFEMYLDMLDCDQDCLSNSCEFTNDFSFDKFIEYNDSVRIVKYNVNKWKLSKCICKDYFKDLICIHILIIALSKKDSSIPEKYLDSLIGSKPRRGKKKKIGPWYDRN
ncbi:unnamed protein product [Brachionus calyciflorus]|uniref:SWIM-type domain-containing protein n=1 Tax=Brachionus calyciflorus TaxID=104777 RepID=A0A814JDN1_9BILA|nr:unnamed protein product [Brachionus calyciflorus]